MKYTLNVIKNGQTINHVALGEGQATTVNVASGLKFQLFDEKGWLVFNPKVKIQGNDLWVFLNEQNEPDLVLANYTQFNAVDANTALEQFNSTFAVGDGSPTVSHHAISDTVSHTSRDTVLAEEVYQESATTAGTGMGGGKVLLGLLGAVGIAAAAGGGGGGSGSGGGSSSDDDSGSEKAPTDIALSNHRVDENEEGAIIGQLTTTDADSQQFTYSVDNNKFEVTADGLLKLKDGQSLDYETADHVTITVTVKDDSNKTYSKVFTIDVVDVDENQVPGDVTLNHNSVFENAAGAVVGLLDTVSENTGAGYTYALSDPSGKFEIVGNVLKIKDGVTLNYESTQHHEVQIASTDQSGKSYPQKSFTIQVDNQYEGVNNATNNNGSFDPASRGERLPNHLEDDDLPYFVHALYVQGVYQYASTPNVWGNNSGSGVNFDQIEDFLGKGRHVVFGFGNKDHFDNAGGSALANPSDQKLVHEDRRAYTEAQKTAVRQAMQHYAKLFNITVEEKVVTDANHQDARYTQNPVNEFDMLFYRGQLSVGQSGYTDMSWLATPSGRHAANAKTSNNIFVNTDDYGDGDTLQSGEGYRVLLHEIGHALGLKHPGDNGDPAIPPFLNAVYASEDSSQNTVMSYHPEGFANKLSHYDIATLEYLYGLNDSYKSGNDAYLYSKQAIISDGAGNDTLDASMMYGDLMLNLNPGSWNYVGQEHAESVLADGQLFIGYDTVIENVIAGRGDDYIVGNTANNSVKAGAGDDVVIGGAGNDILSGQGGTDVLQGGAGNDKFVFDSALDGKIDSILDFSANDTIQLNKGIFKALEGKTAAEALDAGLLQYDASTGELAYDSDGSGSAAAVHFATLENQFALTGDLIQII